MFSSKIRQAQPIGNWPVEPIVHSFRIGTAGWSIARDSADCFPAEGAGLERYAARFNAAEINSSFHRPHRLSTWERWRDSVPENFRFSAKLPKEITHVRKLVDCDEALERFLGEASGLGDKLAVLLVQLPPKLAFERSIVANFFAGLRSRTDVALACEPRLVALDALPEDWRSYFEKKFAGRAFGFQLGSSKSVQ